MKKLLKLSENGNQKKHLVKLEMYILSHVFSELSQVLLMMGESEGDNNTQILLYRKSHDSGSWWAILWITRVGIDLSDLACMLAVYISRNVKIIKNKQSWKMLSNLITFRKNVKPYIFMSTIKLKITHWCINFKNEK